MKTLTISTLAIFAIACAPEASDNSDENLSIEMEENMSAALDEAFSKADDGWTVTDQKNRLEARRLMYDIHAEVADDGCTVFGFVGGTFSDTDSKMKATGFLHRARPIIQIDADVTFAEGPEQIRQASGGFIDIGSLATSTDHPESGEFMAINEDNVYTGIQTADGYSPIYHEGAWVELSDTGEGYVLGLMFTCD